MPSPAVVRSQASRGKFSPAQLSAVSGWLRLASGTITGQGYSSVPDLLASNPAVQSVDADRPPAATSANGLPIMDLDGASDFLSLPAATNNNQTAAAGLVLWVKPDTVGAGTSSIVSTIPGATNRFELMRDTTDLLIDVFFSQFVSRRGTVPGVFSAGVWVGLTWEQFCAGATDPDKCTLTVNGVVRTVNFTDSSGAPGAMPGSLVSTAGPHLIGCRISASHTGCFDGKIGPNIFLLGSRMTGATQGLLTTAARANILGFEVPT